MVNFIVVRAALGLCVVFAFHVLCGTFRKIFGERWLQWFIAITVTQSHFMFYLSRPLPNIFALPLGKSIFSYLFFLKQKDTDEKYLTSKCALTLTV